MSYMTHIATAAFKKLHKVGAQPQYVCTYICNLMYIFDTYEYVDYNCRHSVAM